MKRWLQQALADFGLRVEGTRGVARPLLDSRNLRALALEDVICRRMFEVGQSLSFVQVGAYDGVMADPLHPYIERCGWRGVMIEPQARAASRLRSLYANNDGVTIVQAAVAPNAGFRTLHTVRGDGAPAWAGGLASFDRAHVLKHAALVPGIATMIVEEQVECVSFASILDRLPGRLDVLQLDTEGADAALLADFPFPRVVPEIIHFEVKHLSLLERERCLGLLLRHGYLFAPSGEENMMAVQP